MRAKNEKGQTNRKGQNKTEENKKRESHNNLRKPKGTTKDSKEQHKKTK